MTHFPIYGPEIAGIIPFPTCLFIPEGALQVKQ